MSNVPKIGILGAEGRMGRALLTQIDLHEGAELVAALTIPNSENLGAAYGSTVLSSDIHAALQICDVIIDFSHPKAAVDTALLMHNTHCKTLVTGTTGYSETEEKTLIASASDITLLKSGNFSIGICLLEALVEKAAKTLSASDSARWDASVLDIHHRHKVDAPSGTALMLGTAVKRGQEAGEKAPIVEYAAQRFGGVIGTHHVSLASELETITLSHNANDRSVFAAGALTAALWAIRQPNGLYSMQNVLGL